MESDSATMSQPPADTSVDLTQPSAQPNAGESGAPQAVTVNEGMNAFMRGADLGELTLKPDEGDASGESGPQGLVKPGDPLRGTDGRFLPRRGAPQAVASAEERAAEAERLAAERDPAKLREQHWAEFQAEQARAAEQSQLTEVAKTQQADVERYHRLNALPSADLSVEDWDWLDTFKAKLATFPEVERFHQTAAEQRISAERESDRATLRSQITASAYREGVDPEHWKQAGTSWESMALDLANAREARVRAEVQPQLDRLAELERAQQQSRYTGLNGLASVRPPSGNGRSSAAVALNENEAMNQWLRR